MNLQPAATVGLRWHTANAVTGAMNVSKAELDAVLLCGMTHGYRRAIPLALKMHSVVISDTNRATCHHICASR
jgi:hypothetical protein